jgi:hypothetical protein
MSFLLVLFYFAVQRAFSNEIEFGYNPDLAENEKPTLILTPDADVRVARIRIEAGGKVYSFEKKGSAGEDISFEWPRDLNVTDAIAFVDVVFVDGYVSQAQVTIAYSYGSTL